MLLRHWIMTRIIMTAAFWSGVVAASYGATGNVYVDKGRNSSEKQPMSGCLVSDGVDFSVTDKDGRYSLTSEGPFVFIVVPDGYSCQKWYSANSGTVDFSLVRTEKRNNLFMVVSDIHYASTPEELNKALGDRVMKVTPEPVLQRMKNRALELKPDFLIVLGDMGASIKDLPDDEAVKCLEKLSGYFKLGDIAVRFIPGNHEICAKKKNATDIYEKFFGPDYYSFNSCGTHFISLSTHNVVDKKMKYEIDSRQLEWLKKDLSFVDGRTPVVVFSHEPVFNLIRSRNNAELLTMFAEHNITAHVTGHWHQMARLRDRPFREITCGSLCGGWWEGKTPTGEFMGYSLFSIDRGNIDYGFFNVNEPRSTWFEMPLNACLSGIVQFRVVTSNKAENPVLKVDGEAYCFAPQVVTRPYWTEYYYNLNAGNLKDGRHILEFSDGGSDSATKDVWVRSQAVSLSDIYGNQPCFIGRAVTVAGGNLNLKWGGYIGLSDDKETIMMKKDEASLPFKLDMNKPYSATGVYRDEFTVIDEMNPYEFESVVPMEKQEEAK